MIDFEWTMDEVYPPLLEMEKKERISTRFQLMIIYPLRDTETRGRSFRIFIYSIDMKKKSTIVHFKEEVFEFLSFSFELY